MLDFLRPSNLFVIALVIGVLAVFAKRRWGTILLSAIAAAALFVALFPVGEWMLVPLENRFPQPKLMPAHVDGNIVLGGAVRPFWTYRHDQP
ncbi:MAG TPA: YdcF family protein, partial [Alphaproteobacteria bacterium]|nr:YdcF family protein [Alphaproteobacteria bacterium]